MAAVIATVPTLSKLSRIAELTAAGTALAEAKNSIQAARMKGRIAGPTADRLRKIEQQISAEVSAIAEEMVAVGRS